MFDRLKKWLANELLRRAWNMASYEEKNDWIDRFKVIEVEPDEKEFEALEDNFCTYRR